MPLSEYSASVGGGLKLKGVKDGRVKKQKKKERNTTSSAEDTGDAKKESDLKDSEDPKGTAAEDIDEQTSLSRHENKFGKTEAQLRHEARKRQLTEERIKKEGVKTHKERVEELNRYLSRLSEHHDMPRIGPG